MDALVRNLNALLIIIYSLVISGAFGMQVFEHEVPCPLCYIQRVGMLGICTAAYFNLRFGIRPLHYGLALLSALFGGAVAIRQVTLHVCPGTQTFGLPVFGISLYTWSFFTFVCSTFLVAILLILYSSSQEKKEPLNWLQKIACAFFVFVLIGNVISVVHDCGWGPCYD